MPPLKQVIEYTMSIILFHLFIQSVLYAKKKKQQQEVKLRGFSLS